MNHTSEQKAAIDTHDRNLIVVAGAGSGKTRVLVERYLALLEANPDWPLNALVAITFTRKAAQEMRDRVRSGLQENLRRAHKANDGTVERWTTLLSQMNTARIDTIHGLCTTILRANAVHANLDPAFEVLDETEAQILLEAVIDDVFERLASAESPHPALQLITEYGGNAVRRAVSTYANIDVGDMPNNLFERWQHEWRENAANVVTTLRHDAAFVEAANWQPLVEWPTSDKLYAYWENAHRHLPVLFEANDAEAWQIALDALAAIKINVGTQKAWGGKEALAASKEALYTLRETAKAAQQAIGPQPDVLDQRAAALLPLWSVLIRDVQNAYRLAREQRNVLDFDDLENRTRQLLNEFPHVRARYQNQEFKHLLVDEFQDTNAAQWDIIRALADPTHPGSLFVVGDPKQSIYAFRGADVRVFGDVRREVEQLDGQALPLSRSFRTHQALVAGFNHIFSRILVRDEHSPVSDYQITLEHQMDAQRKSAPGDEPALHLLLVNRSMTTADDGKKLPAEDRRREEGYQLADYLHTMIERGVPIYDKDQRATRPIEYSDIAILFQSMSHIHIYEETFETAGLPFVTVGGRGFYSRQEVWDLLALLQALHNPADNLSLATALRSPLFNLSDNALLALRLNPEIPLWDALDTPPYLPTAEVNRVKFARDCLYELRALSGRITIAELLHLALEKTGYLATLSGLPDGDRRRSNVEKLLDKAQTSGKVTLGAFSQYLADLSAREARESEAMPGLEGRVTLMTVHASKGLEFPLVVLIDADWKKDSGGSTVLIHDRYFGLACKVYDNDAGAMSKPFVYEQAERLEKLRDEAERRRLLYVAATRAQDYLIVSGQVKIVDKDNTITSNGWLAWLLDALDITELTRARIDYDWGSVRLHYLEDPAIIRERDRRQSPTQSAWDTEVIQSGRPLDGYESTPPPLMQDVIIEQTTRARHLSATQIGYLDSPERQYARRFRQEVLHDAPDAIEPISHEPQQISGRRLGEIVHRALRWWQFPTPDDTLDDLLESYAWEAGIVGIDERREAVIQAQRMLNNFQHSIVYKMLRDARQVFREIPFIYQTDRRTIHGIIDVLVQKADNRWGIVDYKTSYVPGAHSVTQNDSTQNVVVQHARRYHLQIGIYAAAVGQYLALDTDMLDACIHYLRYNQTVIIEATEWQQGLDKLENRIGELTGRAL
ncbi:MAG: hypothetical protein D6737_09910 [Chloroflexi bacterium]|nr:MAG: hypothetical protein D6737_09910 [Chloroflexota bacterium]